MRIIADLEVHSKYSRAVSPQMTPSVISRWAAKKGINLVGTGDFTHPMWLRELKTGLEEKGEGIYRLRNFQFSNSLPRRQAGNFQTEPLFLLTSEVSCVYSHNGKGRRVHILIYLPSFSDVDKFNRELTKRGANLFSDGRPVIGLSLSQVCEIALSVNPRAILIPAHVWTPWFGFYGSQSGYDSLFEAFGDLEKHIFAVETGLSSDPAMNWRIEELAGRSIVSFGDAHSPAKLGREATVFEMEKLSYENVRKALMGSSTSSKSITGSKGNNNTFGTFDTSSTSRILYTIEFYPEEGKYHFAGHRNCGISYSPNEARKMGLVCPVCGKNLTLGVMSRVESLAKSQIEIETQKDKFGVVWVKDKRGLRPSYIMLVPLLEILSESLGLGVQSRKVLETYDLLINNLGSEFKILMEKDTDEITKIAGERVAEAVLKVRNGDIVIEPGFDGVFGKVKIWPSPDDSQEAAPVKQEVLF